MSTRKKNLSKTEIREALGALPPIVSPKQLAGVVGVPSENHLHLEGEWFT